ncbi:MAG: LEPR-XLL domain-containing protein, partial [Verrucomicrobiales bacterium]|nr:LEPR-XLL domain-containing protein [Verrucomicrobiales bacterium]
MRIRDPFQLEALEPRVLLSADGVVSSSPDTSQVESSLPNAAASLARETATIGESHASTSGSDWFADVGALPALDALESGTEKAPFGEAPVIEAPSEASGAGESTTQGSLPAGGAGDSDSAGRALGIAGDRAGGSGTSEVIVDVSADGGVTLPDPTSSESSAPVTSVAAGSSAAEVAVETLRAGQGPPESALSEDAEGASAKPAELNPTIPPVRPILIVHGIGGSFPSLTNYPAWLIQRGFDPELLLTDPLMEGYEVLAQSLILSGYKRGETLFEANYDWRVTPGPTDTLIDGVLHNADGSPLTADEITDDTLEHGVDYFGYWLSKASLEWASRHGGALPESVDVIAHSTGGMVVRAYLQSASYGGNATVTSGKLGNGLAVPAGTKSPTGALVTSSLPLPKINDLVT